MRCMLGLGVGLGGGVGCETRIRGQNEVLLLQRR